MWCWATKVCLLGQVGIRFVGTLFVGIKVVRDGTYGLAEKSFPLFCSFLSTLQTIPAQLADNGARFGRSLFSDRCVCRPAFLPMLFNWYYFANLQCGQGSLKLGRHVLLHPAFILSSTLIDCGCSVWLHWFWLSSSRKCVLDMSKHAESVVFAWTTGHVLYIYIFSSSVHFHADLLRVLINS